MFCFFFIKGLIHKIYHGKFGHFDRPWSHSELGVGKVGESELGIGNFEKVSRRRSRELGVRSRRERKRQLERKRESEGDRERERDRVRERKRER